MSHYCLHLLKRIGIIFLMKKLYLVKREVLATSIKNAMTAKGIIYEIQTVDDKSQPSLEKKQIGFKKNK